VRPRNRSKRRSSARTRWGSALLLALSLALLVPLVSASGPGPDEFDGAGYSQVRALLGGQPPASSSQRRARNISLVGALRLSPFNTGDHADVAGYKNLAFVGKWSGNCPATGVDIIDISRPEAPVKISHTAEHPDTSMEDMKAIQIGNRDILAVGLQDCRHDATPGAGKTGLELVDITDPRNPRTLSFYQVGAPVAVGVHEFDLTKTPDGRTLALLAVPNLEVRTPSGSTHTGDLIILDISNPANPVRLAEWGVLDAPGLGESFYLSARRGQDFRTLLHSVRANADGTRAYLSYWDAGVIILKISNPANPTFLGRTAFGPSDEGNAHSVAEARNGTLLIQADEDFDPFRLVFTSSAFTGERPVTEAVFTFPLLRMPGYAMSGQVVHVGRGCPAGAIAPGSPEDPYLANPAGKIALIERGECSFAHKIGRAQQAGAVGVIVYNNAAGGEELLTMDGTNPVTMPDGTRVTLTIPAVFVQRSTGLLLRDGTSPVSARAAQVFNGWGYLRIFDIQNPSRPVPLSTFATANTTNPAVATQGTWSVHNPEVRGNTVYASWYSDGVRIIDISQPSSPREIGFWAGAGAPADAPAVDIWSVVPLGDLLLASDRNFGLYILKLTP
jgi:hypothetical protein